MEGCIFCKIAAGEIESAKVFENEDVFAFLDAFPDTPGHTLIVPKKHFENIFDIDETILQEVMLVGKKVSIVMKDTLGATGIHLANNNGKDAHQEVLHFHLHVVPRYENDGLQMYGARDKIKPSLEELKTVAKKMNAEFAN